MFQSLRLIALRLLGIRRPVSKIVSTLEVAAEELRDAVAHNFQRAYEHESKAHLHREEARRADRVAEKLENLVA